MKNRRNLILGAATSLIVAPSVVRASSLNLVRGVPLSDIVLSFDYRGYSHISNFRDMREAFLYWHGHPDTRLFSFRDNKLSFERTGFNRSGDCRWCYVEPHTLSYSYRPKSEVDEFKALQIAARVSRALSALGA